MVPGRSATATMSTILYGPSATRLLVLELVLESLLDSLAELAADEADEPPAADEVTRLPAPAGKAMAPASSTRVAATVLS